jgi:hypothetical protein
MTEAFSFRGEHIDLSTRGVEMRPESLFLEGGVS